MNGLDKFFSEKHERLLNIAIWAKYLAWVVLGIFAFDAVVDSIQIQFAYSSQFEGQSIFNEKLRNQSLITINAILNTASVLFKGIVYYLILKGTSLGLTMIVETDINYRDQKEQGGKL